MSIEHTDGRVAGLQSEIARLEAQLGSQAEDARMERERLTVELGHRVKNTLSVVQALAGQTFRGIAPDAALESFRDRIVALARANDALIKDSWTNSTVEATARNVLLPAGCAPGPLAIHGPDVSLRASAALSFAMALHELATNAKRFGAWSAPGGRVELAWRLPSLPGDAFELSWTETGGPTASAPDKRGFGLRLIEQSLRSAFGRNITVAFEPAGLACRVRAGLDEIAA